MIYLLYEGIAITLLRIKLSITPVLYYMCTTCPLLHSWGRRDIIKAPPEENSIFPLSASGGAFNLLYRAIFCL